MVAHIPRLEERNVRTGFCTVVVFLTLLAALPKYLRGPCEFAYTYGWRKAEVFWLRCDQVDLVARIVRLDPGTTKNGQGRQVYLTDRLLVVLKGLHAEAAEREQRTRKATPWVFNHDGERIKDIRGAWRAACKKAGLQGLLFYDLRRSAVRNMIRNGVPEVVAMSISGHRTRSVFDRYNVVSEQDLRDASLRIAGDASSAMILAIPEVAEQATEDVKN